MSEASTNEPQNANPGWTRFAPLVVFVLVMAGVVWALNRGGVHQELTTAMIGKPAPAFQLASLDGGAAITPAQFAGKPYLINFFAENCAPCKAEHPVMMDLARQGVPILGVVYKDEAEDAQRYLKELGNPYAAVALDPTSRVALELGVAGTPETFVVAPDGTIRAMHRGQITAEIMDHTIIPNLHDLR